MLLFLSATQICFNFGGLSLVGFFFCFIFCLFVLFFNKTMLTDVNYIFML